MSITDPIADMATLIRNAVSAGKETTFIYDRNFGRHLERKIRLMREYGDAPPRIDPDIMWRVRNLRTPDQNA